MIDTEVKTAIHLHGQVNPEELYDNAVNAILTYDTVTWSDIHKIDMPVIEQPGVQMLVPVGGHIKMMVSYRKDGKPLSDEGDFLLRRAACDNPDCEPGHHYPAHEMIVAFATDVTYSAAGAANCGQIHAALIYQIGNWLEDQGVSWTWASLLNPETHSGYDNLNKMDEWWGEYQQRIAYQKAMESLGPVVPLNSLPGLMIFAEQVAANKAAEDEEEDDDWEDPYADYVEDDE